MSIELKIELKMGPVSVSYTSPDDAELFWTDEAEFLQKVMDLMKYVGTEDDPPADPEPPQRPAAAAPWGIHPGGGFFPAPSPAPLTINGNISVDPETEIASPNVTYDDIQWSETDDDGFDDFDDDDDGGVPQGQVVGRVGGVKEIKAS